MNVQGKITQDKILNCIKTFKKSSFVFDPAGPRERAYPIRNKAFDKWAPLTAIDFGFLYGEQRGMYSFTGKFCHERRFEGKKNKYVKRHTGICILYFFYIFYFILFYIYFLFIAYQL